MFEKISGLFKRFTRRRKKQSGETTIMNGKEPALDEFGLGEEFGEMGGLEDSIDKVGTAPVGRETEPGAEAPFAPAAYPTGEEDFTSGASDFDERTISDEVSGAGLGLEEAGVGAPEGLPGEPGALDFGEMAVTPKVVSPMKRVVTLVVVAVIALILGGVTQIFLWPLIAKTAGLSGADQPKLDIETQVKAAERENAKLKSEVGEFKGMGAPAAVKSMQQQLAQLRDSQGAMEEFENVYTAAKERETAYDELVKRIDGLEADISKTRGDIASVRAQINEARLEVVALARKTEEQYDQFQFELARAEFNQRLLLELQMQDIESFQIELKELDERLARLIPASLQEPSPGAVTPSEIGEESSSGS
ncbi:MAG: hypothetical protein C4532_01705 [Candidatus Abyssobacteria bacterium SURF_17]|jgi:hypothetical protein|uniref:Uncharacterized protein n=1 Tax=Candidatus Abyssobacteria bacterium SURF_17 TaxID=2093361 RepID=A0A419F8K4_9BACT|nr:MAG: hypothetical protein C4532_01705 [Candidatus Abyssubacteria bacterium SURF_17]